MELLYVSKIKRKNDNNEVVSAIIHGTFLYKSKNCKILSEILLNFKPFYDKKFQLHGI